MDNLLQQARELSEISKRQNSDHYFALRGRFESFLDAVIPILEKIQDPEFLAARARQFGWNPGQSHQRTHTLAIMAATLWGADLNTPSDFYDDIPDVVDAAERILSEVEKRNP